jgi:hypothetical protein
MQVAEGLARAGDECVLTGQHPARADLFDRTRHQGNVWAMLKPRSVGELGCGGVDEHTFAAQHWGMWIDYDEVEELDDQANQVTSRSALKLTLDTCCVSALAGDDTTSRPKPKVGVALWAIAGLAADGVARLQLSNAFVRETERLGDDEGRAKRAVYLERAPILPKRAPSVFRWNVSKCNSGDVGEVMPMSRSPRN